MGTSLAAAWPFMLAKIRLSGLHPNLAIQTRDVATSRNEVRIGFVVGGVKPTKRLSKASQAQFWHSFSISD